jgi:hypothetical protein
MRIAHLKKRETHLQVIVPGGEEQWEVGTIFMGGCSHIDGIKVGNGDGGWAREVGKGIGSVSDRTGLK